MSMGTQWRIGIDTDEQTGLVTDGAFGIVRNPIFSAMIVAGVGLALMVPNPISILGVVLLIAAIELQVRYVEEPHLRRLHNDAYTAYALRVGRFLPGIGRN
jgi:protein-S-isoprenylcysteine O-methyltransferase Ste14